MMCLRELCAISSCLHEMRNRLESQRRKRLNVRVYSILPSVQLYQVDDHILASFFPATVPSWESTQHQTRPHYGLGKFLTGHFNELWDGVKTQTLDDYRHLTLERCDPSSERGTARFVIVDEACYVGESDWLRQHISNQGTHGLLLMIIHIYVGDEHSRGPCRLQPIQPGASDHALVHQRFRLKYGEEFLSGIFKIIEE